MITCNTEIKKKKDYYRNLFALYEFYVDLHIIYLLTLKAPIMTAADDSLEYFFQHFSEKIRLDILCESSARQRIHIKHQALFIVKKIKVSSVAILLGTLRVNCIHNMT